MSCNIEEGSKTKGTEHSMKLAKGMILNFFFEIEHYGAILNANRTYYLSRSQV